MKAVRERKACCRIWRAYWTAWRAARRIVGVWRARAKRFCAKEVLEKKNQPKTTTKAAARKKRRQRSHCPKPRRRRRLVKKKMEMEMKWQRVEEEEEEEEEVEVERAWTRRKC